MHSSNQEPPDNPGSSSLPHDDTDETMISRGNESVSPAASNDEKSVDWVGRNLGKYHVTGMLGRGGMGIVYKAHDSTIERDVAIKVLPAEFAESSTVWKRFFIEAKAVGKLAHPNVVRIYDIGQEGQTHFIVMELISGGNAEEQLAEKGKCSVLEATDVLIQACRGIAAAHAVGLVHRDIKPANLLRADDNTIKVADFGLAKGASSSQQQLTMEDKIIGTPCFMSPEQCRSKHVDERSDIYALGATYYALLTAANPYRDRTSHVEIMYAHCHDRVPDALAVDPSLPKLCQRIIDKAMAKHPDDRYQTAQELQSDLEIVMKDARDQDTAERPMALIQGGEGLRQSQSNPRIWRIPTILIASVVILGVIALALFFKRDNSALIRDEFDATKGAVPQLRGDPIVVGVLHSQSGTMAESERPVIDATLLAIENLNNSGGVMGRPVEAIVADGKSKAPIFAKEAQRLIEEEKACTVFGCWTSESRKTVVPLFEEEDHLLIYPVQYEGLEESPNVIYLGAAPNQQILPAIDWAMENLCENNRFFVVGSDYVFPRMAGEIIRDYVDTQGGAVVGEIYLPLGSHNVREAISQIQKTKPDVILNTINGGTNVPFFADLREAGITPQDIPTISFSVGEAELRTLDVSSMVGDYAAWNYFQSIDSPENKQFVDQIRAKYPSLQVVTCPMEAAFTGVELWARAVEEAQSTNPLDIRRALRGMRGHGPSGPIRIDGQTQHAFKTPRIGQVGSDGQFIIVWEGDAPAAPEPYPNTRTAAQWRAELVDLYRGWGDRWSAPPVTRSTSSQEASADQPASE